MWGAWGNCAGGVSKHQVQCIVLSGRAHCQVKYYRCLLVLLKEVMGGKGGPSGSQQTKGVTRKARKTIMLGKSLPIEVTLSLT